MHRYYEFFACSSDNIKLKLDTLQNLVDREIISFSVVPDSDFHHDISFILKSSLRLNGMFWNILLGKSPVKNAKRTMFSAINAGINFADAVGKGLIFLFDHYPELNEDFRSYSGLHYGKTINLLLDPAISKIKRERNSNPFKGFTLDHKLDSFWKKCLLLIYRFNRSGKDLENKKLATLLAENEDGFRTILETLTHDNVLKKNGILDSNEFALFNNDLVLSETALARLSNSNQNKDFDLEEYVSKSGFFISIHTQQNLTQLILPESTLLSVSSIINRLRNPDNNLLADWGLVGASLSEDPEVQNGCNILLHGDPGTGKTFIAGVMANELKRALILVNANNIRDCYYGRTEKRARALFTEMRLLAEKANPVFLLNEGDQLIHRRNDLTQGASDNTENSIQSVFLEEMETFPGVLVVTTNLLNNLDPAMSRRFHYKLEIPIPDYSGRLKLWKLHLPHMIPGAETIMLS